MGEERTGPRLALVWGPQLVNPALYSLRDLIIIIVAWSRTVAPLRDLWQPQQTIALTGGIPASSRT